MLQLLRFVPAWTSVSKLRVSYWSLWQVMTVVLKLIVGLLVDTIVWFKQPTNTSWLSMTSLYWKRQFSNFKLENNKHKQFSIKTMYIVSLQIPVNNSPGWLARTRPSPCWSASLPSWWWRWPPSSLHPLPSVCFAAVVPYTPHFR